MNKRQRIKRAKKYLANFQRIIQLYQMKAMEDFGSPFEISLIGSNSQQDIAQILGFVHDGKGGGCVIIEANNEVNG